jgi:molybdate transport system permease protein
VPVPALVLAAAGGLMFVLPLAGLAIRAPWSALPGRLGSHGVVTALRLSIVTTACATALALLFGVPLAWVQARVAFRGVHVLRAVTTLPIVLPPVAGGVALLLAFGRRGLVGAALHRAFGVTLPFTTAGAVLAQTFVAMPFLVLTVEGALRSTDRRLEDAARTLGAGPWTVFRRVTLPVIRPSVAAGAVLAWARALGEFGATITFAGSFPGRTQTLPLAVYAALESDVEAAVALSLVLVAVSLGILVAMRRRWVGAL